MTKTKNLTKHFFNRRVTNTWNALPHNIVLAPSLNAFKNRLDSHWNNLDIKYNFDVAMAKKNPFSAPEGTETSSTSVGDYKVENIH